MKYFRAFYFIVISMGLLFLTGVIGGFVRLLCFGGARKFVYEVICRNSARLILLLLGIRLSYDKEQMTQLPKRSVIIFNHNSFLDVLILPALPLSDTYSIISEGTKKYFPLYLCNLASSAFWVPLKADKERRAVFFQETTKFLKENQSHSIITSPEGVHLFTKHISKFNREVFEMTLGAKRDFQPLFFDIPAECDPFESFFYRPCRVRIEVMTPIRTTDWEPDNLTERISETRRTFVRRNKTRLKELSI